MRSLTHLPLRIDGAPTCLGTGIYLRTVISDKCSGENLTLFLKCDFTRGLAAELMA